MLVFRKTLRLLRGGYLATFPRSSLWPGSASHVAAATRCRPVTQPATATTRHRVSPRRGVGSRRDCRYAQLHAAHAHTRGLWENAANYAISSLGGRGDLTRARSVKGWPTFAHVGPCAPACSHVRLSLCALTYVSPPSQRLHTRAGAASHAASHAPVCSLLTLAGRTRSITSSAPRQRASQPPRAARPLSARPSPARTLWRRCAALSAAQRRRSRTHTHRRRGSRASRLSRAATRSSACAATWQS